MAMYPRHPVPIYYNQYHNAYPVINYQQPPSAANGYGWHGNGYGWQLDPRAWQTPPIYPRLDGGGGEVVDTPVKAVEEPMIQAQKVTKQNAWYIYTFCTPNSRPCSRSTASRSVSPHSRNSSPCRPPYCIPCCVPCCVPCIPCCVPCKNEREDLSKVKKKSEFSSLAGGGGGIGVGDNGGKDRGKGGKDKGKGSRDKGKGGKDKGKGGKDDETGNTGEKGKTGGDVDDEDADNKKKPDKTKDNKELGKERKDTGDDENGADGEDDKNRRKKEGGKKDPSKSNKNKQDGKKKKTKKGDNDDEKSNKESNASNKNQGDNQHGPESTDKDLFGAICTPRIQPYYAPPVMNFAPPPFKICTCRPKIPSNCSVCGCRTDKFNPPTELDAIDTKYSKPPPIEAPVICKHGVRRPSTSEGQRYSSKNERPSTCGGQGYSRIDRRLSACGHQRYSSAKVGQRYSDGDGNILETKQVDRVQKKKEKCRHGYSYIVEEIDSVLSSNIMICSRYCAAIV